MTDWAYKEARDRSLRALLAAPAKRHDLGIDWSYVAAVEWRRFETEYAVQLFWENARLALQKVTEAVIAIGEALVEAFQPIIAAMNEIFAQFRQAVEEPEIPTDPPPWRTGQRTLNPRTIGGPLRTVATRPILSHRPRDHCRRRC